MTRKNLNITFRERLKSILRVDNPNKFQDMYSAHVEELYNLLFKEEVEKITPKKDLKNKQEAVKYLNSRQGSYHQEKIKALDANGNPINIRFNTPSDIDQFLKKNPKCKVGVNLEETKWVCILVKKNANFERSLKHIAPYLILEKLSKRFRKRFFWISKGPEGFIFLSRLTKNMRRLSKNQKNCYSVNGFQADYYFKGFFQFPITKEYKTLLFAEPSSKGLLKSFYPLKEIPAEEISALALDKTIINSSHKNFEPAVVMEKRLKYYRLFPETSEVKKIATFFFTPKKAKDN